MLFLHKRKFGRLVDEKEAAQKFSEVRPELEKGDLPALIIAAVITFLPYVLALTAVLMLFAWLFGG